MRPLVAYSRYDMRRPPLILITPDVDEKGAEFGDLSLSLSGAYQETLLGAGAIPVAMGTTVSAPAIAEYVSRCDGVLLSGGGDVDPRLYAKRLASRLGQTVKVTPDGGRRDLRELLLIDEVFRQRKPLFAICRGQQILNVALGGTLLVDIPSQIPRALNHRRMDRRSDVVHEVRLTRDSILGRIAGGLELSVNSTHHQAVGRVAPALRVAGFRDERVIEALELKPGVAYGAPFLLSVQFHPERLADRHPEHRALFDTFVQACVFSRDKSL